MGLREVTIAQWCGGIIQLALHICPQHCYFMYFLWACIYDCIGVEKGLEEILHLKMVVTFREQGLGRV